MRKINYIYYLFLLLLAPFTLRLISLFFKPNLNFKLFGLKEPFALYLLLILLLYLLTILKDIGQSFSLALLWALGQQRIWDLGQHTLQQLWTVIITNFSLESLFKIILTPSTLTIIIYLILVGISIKITALKGTAILKFIFWTIIFYQLGYNFISYKI